MYRALVGLHPREFRERFGPEMMAIFEAAGETKLLLADAVLSVLRQRILRGALWRAVPMLLLTIAPWMLLAWVLTPVPAGPPRAVTAADFYLLTGVVAVLTAGLTTLLALTWQRIRRPAGRRRHA